MPLPLTFADRTCQPHVTVPVSGLQVLGNVGEWFRRLTAADSGILYEDTYLQVCPPPPPPPFTSRLEFSNQDVRKPRHLQTKLNRLTIKTKARIPLRTLFR